MATATEAPAGTTAEGLTSHTQNQLDALTKLRVPFDPSQISKLPKIWCGKCNKSQYKVCDDHRREKCQDCDGKLTNAHLHLDYVGHAELTGRLLEVDPLWTWEPLAFDQDGLPKFDRDGGLWIRLTVAGHTRLGYGDSQGKNGPNAVKEAIGDALRNAAMRFGAALNLWSKTDMDEAAGQKKDLTAEPSREDRLAGLYSAMQQRWGHLPGLRAVRAQVGEENFHESQVADMAGTMRLFGELIDERIRELADAKRQQNTTTPSTPATDTPATEGAARPDPVAAAADALLDKLVEQAAQNRGQADVLRQVRGAAEKGGVINREVQGPPPERKWMPFHELLDALDAEAKAVGRRAV